MNVTIQPSRISGTITAPPSKSVTHRVILLASLSTGVSTIENVLDSQDISYTIQACEALGVKIEREANKLTVFGSGGALTAQQSPIFVGNSGSTIRMVSGLAAIAQGTTVLTGEKRLQERPMDDLLTALQDLGISAQATNNNECPPVEIIGGSIKGGKITVSGYTSSQYITSLLLISPFAKEDMEIIVPNLRSKPYVALTIDLMKTFGVTVENDNFERFVIKAGQRYHERNYTVEGDYSSASYAFAAAAVTGGNVSVKGLNPYSKQGDAYFLKILEEMCCDVSIHGNTITVNKSKVLKPVIVDMGDYPDIVQSLAVVAAYANGKTRITNIGHLRHKETDRINKPSAELKKMGIQVTVNDNSMTITGGKPKGAAIDTHNDHRMAMAFAVAALGSQGTTTIEHAEVVNKSYPEFWNDLKTLGANIAINHEP